MAWPHRAGQGGICGLVTLLAEHYEAIEADLATVYGDRDQLPRLWSGGLSYRRLWVLIQGLPVTSKTRQAIAGHELWSDEQALLVKISNQQAVGNWMFVQSKSKDAVPFPELIQPPAAEVPKPVSPSRLRHLEMIRANHGATPTKDGDA